MGRGKGCGDRPNFSACTIFLLPNRLMGDRRLKVDGEIFTNEAEQQSLLAQNGDRMQELLEFLAAA